jgi:hypothetical protein
VPGADDPKVGNRHEDVVGREDHDDLALLDAGALEAEA